MQKSHNTYLVAKNVLIHCQLEEILNEASKNNIKVVLLKGAALIELFPEYSFERDMEDIDILVSKKDYKKFINILLSLGYNFCHYDPMTLYKKDMPVKVDVCCKLWYLSEKENTQLMNKIVRIKNFYILPPEEMLKNIVYHMYVEHNFVEEKWMKDVLLLKHKFGIEDKEIEKIINHKIFNLLSAIPLTYKGHILQLFILPFTKKILYIFSKFFPNKEFLIRRYMIKKNTVMPMYYLYRWCDILVKTVNFFSKLLAYHLSTFFSTQS